MHLCSSESSFGAQQLQLLSRGSQASNNVQWTENALQTPTRCKSPNQQVGLWRGLNHSHGENSRLEGSSQRQPEVQTPNGLVLNMRILSADYFSVVIYFCYDKSLINADIASLRDIRKRENKSRELQNRLLHGILRVMFMFLYHADSPSAATAITSPYKIKGRAKFFQLKQDIFK